MITLELIRRSSPAAPAVAVAAPFTGTALQLQPAPGQGAPNAPDVVFPGVSKPSPNMEAVRSALRPPFETVTVDLTAARSIAAGTAAVVPIQGTAYFIDKGSDVGQATFHLNDQTAAPLNTINVFPGDANNNIPFTFILLENTAQPGKLLRIHFGTDIQFLPGLGGNITFTGGVSILQTVAGAPQGVDQATFNGKAWSFVKTATAVAAQNSIIDFEYLNTMPAGLNIYIDQLIVWSSVATRVLVSHEANAFINGNISQAIPKKGGGTGFPNGCWTNNLANGNPHEDHQIPANQDVVLPQTYPYQIPQGTSLAIGSVAVNLQLVVTAHGRTY